MKVEHKRSITDFTLDKTYYRSYQPQSKYGNLEMNRPGFQDGHNNNEYSNINLKDANQISMEDTKLLIDRGSQ